ncbi:hypothetical protein EXIGLDRAFT_747021 [Exidia glandulosa HHB12029]|uniref:DUF6697 domain-containing protein n=1 Tax=Exidia glandulosa HHB12029 TaxID=1314781 RepID=A0A165L8F5_EXIGL|nr:hypothetical protein EXIGLDRAFT_747021 [Exidia glandulosa HHB12029]
MAVKREDEDVLSESDIETDYEDDTLENGHAEGQSSILAAPVNDRDAAEPPFDIDISNLQSLTQPKALKIWHQRALAAFGLTTAHPALGTKPHPVRRDLVTKLLGGNLQSAFTVSRDKREHVFAKPDQNPFLPSAPGDHGLLYTFQWRTKDTTNKPVRLFVRQGNAALWTYMGEYIQAVIRPLSPDEWNIQPAAVKKMRAKSAVMRKSANVKEIKGRIVKTKEAEDDSEAGAATVSHTDILQALDVGTARLLVVGLKCVGFDLSLQKKLVGGIEVTPSPLPTASRKQSSPRKPKRARSESSDDEPSEADPSASRRKLPRRAAKPAVAYVDSDSE